MRANMDLTCRNSSINADYLLGQLNTARQEINNLRYCHKNSHIDVSYNTFFSLIFSYTYIQCIYTITFAFNIYNNDN